MARPAPADATHAPHETLGHLAGGLFVDGDIPQQSDLRQQVRPVAVPDKGISNENDGSALSPLETLGLGNQAAGFTSSP